MSASREAYDLRNPACRRNAWQRIKRGGWIQLSFWRLVWSDTLDRVCPRHNPWEELVRDMLSTYRDDIKTVRVTAERIEMWRAEYSRLARNPESTDE